VITADIEEETFCHRSLRIMVHYNASTNFNVQSFFFNIPYVGCHAAGKMVRENSTHLLSWHWPGDDKSILLIVKPIIDIRILSITNSAIAGLTDPSCKIRKLCGCCAEPEQNGGPYGHNDT